MIEDDLIDCFQYVEPSLANLRTYSVKFYRLHQDICREIDAVFKLLLKESGKWPKGRRKVDIRQYRLLLQWLHLRSEAIRLRENREVVVRPFWYWPVDRSPTWWKDHTELKHHGIAKHFEKASLKNVIHSLGGLILLLNRTQSSWISPMSTRVFVDRWKSNWP
ncbi:MAG: hypothetical protein ACE5IO_04400 [Thermoplasmata archaeon]